MFERLSSWPFLHTHFNDLLLIPAALPLVLWLQRRLSLRKHDSPPTAAEICGHWLVWSVISEGIGPHVFAHATADILDVVAYGAGAIVAGVWWHRMSPLAPAAGFDSLAAHYDWMEAVLAGKKLERCRNALWNLLPPITNVVLAGEGHGKFLVELLQRHPKARVTCVDGSAKMLEVSRKRLQHESLSIESDQVKFIHTDILEWCPPTCEFDLVVTQFFLDCFTHEQLSRLIPRLAAAAKTDASWLVSDFQIPGAGLAHWRAKAIHWLMYRFFRAVTNLPAAALASPSELLQQCGFKRAAHQEFDWGLLYCDLWKTEPPFRINPKLDDNTEERRRKGGGNPRPIFPPRQASSLRDQFRTNSSQSNPRVEAYFSRICACFANTSSPSAKSSRKPSSGKLSGMRSLS